MTTKAVSNNPCIFECSRSILPSSKDAIMKKVIKLAVIFLSLGTIFAAAFALDITKAVLIKLTKRNHTISIPKLNSNEKIYMMSNKFWDGFKEGFLQMINGTKHVFNTISFNAHRQSPYNRFGITLGYMTAITSIFYLAAGCRGLQLAAIVNLAGLSFLPIQSDKPSQQIEKKAQKA